MGLSLDRLVFDPSVPADGAKVGSHILAGDDGTAIGHVSDALKASITNSSIAVTATNLDIRDLVFASDKVDASGTTLGANSGVDIGDVTVNNGSGAAAVNIQDGGNSITVDGTVTAAPYGAVSAVYSATSVTSTATKIIATNLANRISVMVQNLGAKDMFFGDDSSVTTANGIKVGFGQSLELAWGPSVNLYAITASGTADVRYLESA